MVRKCGICRCPGHDRRTCSKSKDENISDKKIRASCENNWAEMVFAVTLLYPDVKTKKDVQNKLELLIHNKFKCSGGNDNIYRYFTDINKRPEKFISEYISNIDLEKLNYLSIKEVILSGKNINEFPEIQKINTCKKTGKLYDLKKRKSDLYIIFNDNKIIGISLKSNDNCTLTNYSIERRFSEIIGKEISNNLKEIRINMLKEKFGEEYKYKKGQRSEANKLFYDKNNEYFKKIIEIIEDHNDIFTGHLVSYVFPKLEYDVYGYNGTVLKDLNSLSSKIHGQSQMIKRENKYETETAAKIWFSLYLDDVESWKFCIRGKNDIYKGSFQVLEFQKIH